MKSISIRQPYASLILGGEKTIEIRSWPTKYRGPILIVSSASPKIGNLPTGQALCIAHILDCRPSRQSDKKLSQCQINQPSFSWILGEVIKIPPFPVRESFASMIFHIQ